MVQFFLDAMEGIFPLFHKVWVLLLGPSDVVLEVLVNGVQVEYANSRGRFGVSWFWFDWANSRQPSVFVRYLIVGVDKESFGKDYYLFVITLSSVC
jgi:hypothetical protein